MKTWLIQKFNYWRFKIIVKLATRKFGKAVAEVRKMPPEAQQAVLRKWKWDARKYEDDEISQKMLAGLEAFEKSLCSNSNVSKK